MAVEFRDYYEVLGVSRQATAEEVKKAFRSLARKFHPDVAKGDTTAEARFKEINEAYEVLGDPEKRRKYDALGPSWKHGAEFRPPPGGGFQGFPGGGQFHYHFGGSTGFSDFFESLFGSRSSADPFSAFGGRAQSGPIKGADIESDLLVTLEEVMKGAERLLKMRSANDREERTIRVRIPAGVADGQLIRCSGFGQPGRGGGASGDLLLRVRMERHPIFKLQGPHLQTELEVAPWECILGAEVEIETLQGNLKVRIPPQTPAGSTLRLRGRGVPDREREGEKGDLHVVLSVAVPTEVSGREKRLWEELARISKFRPRKNRT